MKAGKMLIGLFSGAAAGAALGLLFAPKKGAETRRAISQTGDNYLEGAKKGLHDFSDSISHKVDALRSKTKANLSSSKAKEKANEAKAEIHKMKAG